MRKKIQKPARRVALVTGGSRGLGRELALFLARGGIEVAVAYQNDRLSAEKTLAELRRQNVRALIRQTDMRRWRQVEKLVEEVKDHFGRIDILINNVGSFVAKPFEQIEVEEWSEMIDSNLNSAFYGCKAVGPIMKRQRFGRIINIGLANANRIHAFKKTLPYAIAKTGVLILTRSLASEWAPYHITVNAILPGLMDNGSVSRALRTRLGEQVPAGRPGRGEDVAGVMGFLISEEADYVTGAEIVVSGGWGL